MAATNVQAFPGDVTITSNLAVSGSKFTYDNIGTTVFTGRSTAIASEIGYLDMSTSSASNNTHVKIFIKMGSGGSLSEAEYSFYIRPNAANFSLIYDYRNRNNTMTPVVYRTNATNLHAGGTSGVVRFGYSTASAQNVVWRVEVIQRSSNATFYPTNTGSAVVTTNLVHVTPAPFTRFDSNVAVGGNKLFVDTIGGTVGIGTTAPQNKLAVVGNVTVGAGASTTTSAYHAGMLNVIGGGTRALLRIENNSSIGSPGIIFGEGGVFTEDTVPTIKKVQGTNNLAIMTNGNVGIGADVPPSKLTVNAIPAHRASYDHSLAPMTITNPTVTSNTTLNDPKHVLNLAREGTANESHGANAAFKLSRWENNGTNSRTRLDLSLAHNAYTDDYLMTFRSDGKVGIGTNAPSELLDLNPISPATDGIIRLRTVGGSSGECGLKLTESTDYGFQFVHSAVSDLLKVKHQNGSGVVDKDNMMVFNPNGNVGIGVSPSSFLDVALQHGETAAPMVHFRANPSGDSQGDGNVLRLTNSGQRNDVELFQCMSSTNTKFVVTAAGNIGVGRSAPTCLLDLPSTVTNRKIGLYGGTNTNGTDHYGFGINSSTLRYNVDSTSSYHRFYGGNTQYGYIGNANPGFVNSFTGQHKSFPHESLSGKTLDELSGLIVCASGEHISVNDAIPQRGQDGITVSEAIPSVKLSVTENEKTVFGVVSNVEDPESTEREDRSGAFASTFKKIVGDTRIYVNSIGEGAIWVVNTNGSFVNGDYITTSNVAGYGQNQASDSLKNYTVAKITMDCDFVGTTAPKKRIKKKTVTETLEETVEEEYEDNMAEDVYTYDVDHECYVKTVKDDITTKTRSVMQEYELRDSDGNVITETASNTITIEQYEALENKEGWVANNDENTEIIQNYTQTINKPVVYSGNKIVVNTVTHEVDDLDEHGQLQWEDHATEIEKAYKIRYLDANGVITDEANIVHIAAFVGCTYHCG